MGEVCNPILKGFYPDPSICRVGEDYYLVTSTFGYAPGVPIFHSRDLISWQQLGHVLNRREQLDLSNAGMSDGIFAPTIRYHDGFFYMITTNVKGGGNFYVTAQNPAGPWSDPVYLKGAEGFDPSLFFEGGKCYYVGQRAKKEKKYPGDCEIWIQELDLKKGELIGEIYSVWDGALKDSFWAEGPHLYKKGGYYYLLIAEGGTAFEHSICIARSRELLRGYEPCPLNPIFTHRNLGRKSNIQNTGHGDFIETPDGQWYMVMLGTRPIDGYAPLGRETFLAEVIWENGWPVINPGEGKIREVQHVHLKPEKQYLTEKAMPKREEQNLPLLWTEPLDKRCVFFRYPEENMYHITDTGEVALKVLPQTLADIKPPAYIGVRVDAFDFTIRTKMTFTPHDNEEAGLVYLYDEKNYVRFVMSKAEADNSSGLYEIKVILTEKGQDNVLDVMQTAGEIHTLEYVLKGLSLCCILDGKTITEQIKINNLTTEVTYGFVGCTAGIYASSNNEGDGSHFAYFDKVVL